MHGKGKGCSKELGATASNQRHPSEPRPAENARRGSATCRRPPATREARARGPEREKAARPRGGRRPFFFAQTRETLTPQTKGGTLSGPPPPGASLAPPRPKPRATRPGGRRRPSLPQGRPCSTFGAGRLNFRVRYGSGCAPAAVAAGPRGALRRGLRGGGSAPKAPWGPHRARGRECLENGRERRGRLRVPKGSAD